jgi:hypothetical protein
MRKGWECEKGGREGVDEIENGEKRRENKVKQ